MKNAIAKKKKKASIEKFDYSLNYESRKIMSSSLSHGNSPSAFTWQKVIAL